MRLVQIPLVVTLEEHGQLLYQFVQILRIRINNATGIKKLLTYLCKELNEKLAGSFAFPLEAKVVNLLDKRFTWLNHL